jgi:hypothetical protein
MGLFDMMRVGITKKDAFSCLILVLLRGLVFEGLARDLTVSLGCGGSCSQFELLWPGCFQ